MKVFLKYNRDDTGSKICLYQWLEIFRSYEIIIACDLFTPDNVPDYLKNIDPTIKFKIVNTDYSTGNVLPFKARKKKQASANLSCFKHAGNDRHFWIVDADDTQFLVRDPNLVREKLKIAEKIFLEKNLDGFSLDFYRETHFDHWSFGVCLLKTKLDLSKLDLIKPEDVDNTPGLTKNLDSWFDMLRRKKIYNLESFVFDNIPFQHCINPMTEPMHGIYFWNNKKLGNIDLKPDVISI
jgi:hypothetical protein